LWTKTYPKQAICIFWDQTSNTLCTGLDSGKIDILKVSAELNYSKFNTIAYEAIHKGRIMGLYYEYITGYLYTISEDKTFIVYDTSQKGIIAQVKVGDDPLTKLIVQKEAKRAFISDNKGHIKIFDISPCPPNHLKTIGYGLKRRLTAMCFNSRMNYIFASNKDKGLISIFDIGKPGREKFSKVVGNYQSENGGRELLWLEGRQEFAIGFSNGNISFWNAKIGKPIFM